MPTTLDDVLAAVNAVSAKVDALPTEITVSKRPPPGAEAARLRAEAARDAALTLPASAGKETDEQQNEHDSSSKPENVVSEAAAKEGEQQQHKNDS